MSRAVDGGMPLQTTKSYLVLASLHQKPDETPYGTPRLGSSSLRTFLSGPGEAISLQALVIRFEGVIRMEGSLLKWVFLPTSWLADSHWTSVSPRKHCIMFSARNPSSVQRIPWPRTDAQEPRGGDGNAGYDYDSWSLNEQCFDWPVDTNGPWARLVNWKPFIF